MMDQALDAKITAFLDDHRSELIADIREYLVKNGKLGSVKRRDLQTGLSHQGKQTDRL